MSKGKIIGISILAVVVIAVFSVWSWYMKTYNRLVQLDESVSSAWAQVENQLQRRYDLIPNLVNTVKGYAQHEEKVLTEVTEARSRVGSAQTIPEKMEANNGLSSALSRLLVVTERYPDLKANQGFLDLQSQLEGTENRIATERKRYNDKVQEYNVSIRGLFEQFVARRMNLTRKTFFEADKASKQAPEVKF
jgi:LemA protein